MQPPLFPFGEYDPVKFAVRTESIALLAAFPKELAEAVHGLTDAQLDTKYRNWTLRQIVHHVADSHVNSYVRFKWALTEETPKIKSYDESLWSALSESLEGDIAPSLALLTGLHARWCQLLSKMTDVEFARDFLHPETGATIRLEECVGSYAWHGKHHMAQILWVREQHGI